MNGIMLQDAWPFTRFVSKDEKREGEIKKVTRTGVVVQYDEAPDEQVKITALAGGVLPGVFVPQTEAEKKSRANVQKVMQEAKARSKLAETRDADLKARMIANGRRLKEKRQQTVD